MGGVDGHHALVAQGAVLLGERPQSFEVGEVRPQAGDRAGRARRPDVQQDPGTQCQGFGALGAPAVADRPLDVAALAGDRAQVGDAAAALAMSYASRSAARRLQQRHQGDAALGQAVFALAPGQQPVGQAYVLSVADLGQDHSGEAGVLRRAGPRRPSSRREG